MTQADAGCISGADSDDAMSIAYDDHESIRQDDKVAWQVLGQLADSNFYANVCDAMQI